MTQNDALLNPGDHFPAITVSPVDAPPVDLPDALAGHFAVVLFNRGSWCPYCNAQLRAFQRATDKLTELGVKVVSMSVDDEATARELIAKHDLTFPVGHSADASSKPRIPAAMLISAAALSWGLSAAVSKIALEQLGPLDLLAVEVGVGAAVLVPASLMRTSGICRPRAVYLLLGVLEPGLSF